MMSRATDPLGNSRPVPGGRGRSGVVEGAGRSLLQGLLQEFVRVLGRCWPTGPLGPGCGTERTCPPPGAAWRQCHLPGVAAKAVHEAQGETAGGRGPRARPAPCGRPAPRGSWGGPSLPPPRPSPRGPCGLCPRCPPSRATGRLSSSCPRTESAPPLSTGHAPVPEGLPAALGGPPPLARSAHGPASGGRPEPCASHSR